MSKVLTRRAVLGGVVAIAALVPAATAGAYSPGGQGQVGVGASYVMSASTFDDIPGQSPGDSTFTRQDTQTGTESAEAKGPGFVFPTTPVPPVDTACIGGCAGAESVVGSRTQPGTLETYGRAYGWAVGQGHEALGDGTATSNVDDMITVSKDTVVTLRGRITGHLERHTSGDDQLRPKGEMEVRIGMDWCGSEGCDFALYRTYEPEMNQSMDVDEPFEVQVPLEAGEHPFNAELRSIVSAAATGIEGHPSDGSDAQSDAHMGDGDDHEVTFEIVAPDDVAISSESGKLPIVGGQAPEETDTTPPTLSVPDAIVADATSPAGAVVRFDVTATDESGEPTVTCDPASGSRFAVGDTTVSCVATDAAGNETAKSFVVKVRGADAILGDLLTKIGTLHPKAQKQLKPHAKLTCQGMRQVVLHTALLTRQGYMSLQEGLEVGSLAFRIARALDC